MEAEIESRGKDDAFPFTDDRSVYGSGISLAGCASRLPGPSPKQEWISFDEYSGVTHPESDCPYSSVVEIRRHRTSLEHCPEVGWPATETIDPTLDSVRIPSVEPSRTLL